MAFGLWRRTLVSRTKDLRRDFAGVDWGLVRGLAGAAGGESARAAAGGAVAAVVAVAVPGAGAWADCVAEGCRGLERSLTMVVKGDSPAGRA